MTEDDNPWRAPDQRPEPTRPLTDGAWVSPSSEQPPPEQPAAPAPPEYPTSYPPPPQPTAPQQQVPFPGAYPPPSYAGYGAPQQPVATTVVRSKLGGWVLPVVAVTALVLGIGGGLLGGYLASDSSGGDGSGGVLRVEKRVAAPLPADNGSVAAVARKLLPSTVQIIAEYDGNPRGATGSGWVLDGNGHIITNNHVVAEAAKDDGNIEIVDQFGNHGKATVIGRSTVYDVAVLKSEFAKKLTPVKLGSSQQMNVGETVVAFGSPLGLSSTVTSGIISARDRPVTTGESDDDLSYINAVQTDAAINPGNSGGPLVDLQGQVVGMNSAIASLGSVSSDQGGSIGVGFAIPIEQIVTTTDQILKTGKAEYPVIGASVSSNPDVDGAKITAVTDGDPAKKAGLHTGDLVTRIDDTPVATSIDLIVAIRSHVRGDVVDLTVKRGAATKKVELTLSAKTDSAG